MPAASTLPYMQQQDMPMASEASIEGIGSVRGRGCRRPCSQTAVAVSAGRQTIRACELGRSSLKREMQPPPFLVFPSVAASGGTWCDHAGPEYAGPRTHKAAGPKALCLDWCIWCARAGRKGDEVPAVASPMNMKS